MGSGATACTLTDTFMRRLALPLVLIAAVIFRYNLFSFLYLLILLVSVLLPAPRLKHQKVISLLLHIVLLVFSLLAAIAQALFQISLETDYTLDKCKSPEPAWRQCGFIQYENLPAIDIVRHLLPDVVVFLVTLVTLCFNVVVMRMHSSNGRGEGEGREGRREGEQERSGSGRIQLEEQGSGGGRSSLKEPQGAKEADVEENDEMADLSSGSLHPPFPPNAQSYWRVPKVVVYFLDGGIFFLLGVSGVTVPSLTSFAYYFFFFLLLTLWSLHLRSKLKGFVRVLRALTMLYSALHLLLLHLYQFQTAQDRIPVEPKDTTKSLLARLFGLTPVILTDCNHPTELLVRSGVIYTEILSPILILGLFWILATDLRMWLFTPRSLWTLHGTYSLPVLDQPPSSRVSCVVRREGSREQTILTQYGTYNIGGESTQTGGRSASAGPLLDTTNSGDRKDISYMQYKETPIDTLGLEEPLHSGKEKKKGKGKRKMTEKDVWEKVVSFTVTSWNLFMSVNFIFSIVVMMLWSVLYPSWPALVLLLWACGIWLIPKVNPAQSLYYTSPFLVLYALALVCLQYIYSLNLTRSELPRHQSLGLECTKSTVDGCRSLVIAVKTAFACVFFASFHEFVKIMKRKWRNRRRYSGIRGDSPDDHEEADPTDSHVSQSELARSKIYSSLKELFSTYWVLVVIGAFLLVFLTGTPSLLKTIYLIFFFVFLVTYQVSRRYWYYLSVPVWWCLVVYAIVDLVLVYTYQFDVVSDAWEKRYNGTDPTFDQLFESIGLIKSEVDALSSLIKVLVPPAIFIAVVAVQLRYFKPVSKKIALQYEGDSGSALDLTSLLPKFIQSAIRQAQSVEGEAEEVEEGPDGEEAEEEAGEEALESVFPREPSLKRQRTSSTVSSIQPTSKVYKVYRVLSYILLKIRQVLVDLFYLMWRFLELHSHKIVSLILFVVVLSQISAAYWILLATLLVVVPLPYLNPLTFPLMTIYLGVFTTLRMIYQLPIFKTKYFDLSSNCSIITTINETGIEGEVFNDSYSPRGGDGAWFGFHKTDDFANYVAGPIIAVLLLSLWFSSRRHQAHYYHTEKITIRPWERGSLFLKVPRQEAECSILAAAKYLINHFYEMYGIEICWTMLAITVAVRIDVYGIFYALILGLLLFTPRRVLAPIWFCYLLIHGLLLLVQYSMLLGAPYGACVGPGGKRDYPWEDIDRTSLRRWLFLTEYQQILDKNLLYADFLVYILVCLQIYYFHDNPLKKAGEDTTDGLLAKFLKPRFLLDYIKILVFQYSFWVSLFLLFFTAAIRISLFGFVYLLLCFLFLYRGQEMLKDSRTFKHRSWAFIRVVTWMVLLVRVSLQIIDCVYSDKTEGSKRCILISLFNAGCNRRNYYGSPDPNAGCSSSPENVGLWVDALNFAIITLQIIIFDSKYSESIRQELRERELNANFFADVFDTKVAVKQEEAQEKRKYEVQEIQERADELTLTENRIDHLLYAGVKIPPDIQVRQPRQKSSVKSKAEGQIDPGLELSETISIHSDDPKPKPQDTESLESSEEEGTCAKFGRVILEAFDTTVDWLESTSALYRDVVGDLHNQPETSASPTGIEQQPFAGDTESYGSTAERKDSLKKKHTPHLDSGHVTTGGDHVTKEVPVEVYTESERTSLNSYKAAMQDENLLKEDDTANADQHPELGEATPLSPIEEVGVASPRDRRAKDRRNVLFDERGDALIDALHLAPSDKQQQELDEFEAEIEEKTKQYGRRPKRLLTALYFAFLAHSEYIAYFFVILNVILNGSILSLVYAFLLFTWGLLSIPWPSKKFWLTMIFFTMLVVVIKYSFQFYDISYWRDNFQEDSGLYPPRLIGILYRSNFFSNVVWDLLLLITLLFHRGLLKESGLWRDTESEQQTSNFLKQIWYDVKRFVSRLVNPEITLGAADYYVLMLLFDTLCLLTIIFGFSSFGVGIEGQDVQDVANFIQTNSIPLSFVIMLLLQFISMLIDRAIYLRHSLWGKFVFHIILLVLWHTLLFFVLPSDNVTRRPFTSNTAAQCIYFFKCCYFIISALQIVAGYPTRVLGYFLGSKYTMASGLSFQVYRAIPLLPELREVMDWMFTDTTLTLLHWLRVQEIYAQVYLVKVRRKWEENDKRDLGDPQPWWLKILLGGLLLGLLVLLIWGPLLLFSIIGSSSRSNPPVGVSISLQLNGYQPLVEMTVQPQSIMPLNSNEYNDLRDLFEGTPVFPVFSSQFNRENFRRVLLQGQSTSLWTISPPARESLLKELNSNNIFLEFSWSITRMPSTGLAAETVSGSTPRNITDNITISEFIDVLENPESSRTVSLPNLYPLIILAPATGGSQNFTLLNQYTCTTNNSVCRDRNLTANVSCDASLSIPEESLSNITSTEWWSLSQSSSHAINFNQSGQSPTDLELIIYSERIALPLFNSVAALGIIGLYVSVVLVVGRAIRGFIAGLPSQLIVDEIWNPDPLLKLCNDIFLVRESKDFKLEEILVGKLFFIFRSPERLVSLTEGTKLKQE